MIEISAFQPDIVYLKLKALCPDTLYFVPFGLVRVSRSSPQLQMAVPVDVQIVSPPSIYQGTILNIRAAVCNFLSSEHGGTG